MPPQPFDDQLKLFAATSDVEALKQAAAQVELLPTGTGKNAEENALLRKQKLSAWFAVLNEMDKKTIPNFDLADLPPMGAAPPPGVSVPMGVDPSAIQNPEARAKYQQAIKENAEKVKRYNLQYELSKLNPKYTARTKFYITTNYARPAENPELLAAVQKEIYHPDRKDQLRQAIEAK